MKDNWLESSQDFIGKLNVSFEQLKRLKKNEISSKVKAWDSEKWKEEVEEKKSLEIYCKWKENVQQEEELYDNRPASEIMYRARTNNLKLQDRMRHQGRDTKCIMCEEEVENLTHFILWCPAYNQKRGN